MIIPNNVTTIGESAFEGCSSLIKSAYPNTLSNPFVNGISVAYTPDVAIIEDGIIYDPDKSSILFATYKFTGDYDVPSSVTSIGGNAFYGCSGLTGIVFPNSVTTIGESAFYGCSALTEITIGNNVTSIGESAF